MADQSDQIGQDEIENLLRQAQDAGGARPTDSGVPAADPPAAVAALAQHEIEHGMVQGGSDSPTDLPTGQTDVSSEPTAAATARQSVKASPPSVRSTVSQNDMNLLLNKAEQALASVDETRSELPSGIQTFQFKDLSGTSANTESATLELMGDVQLDLTIELGRTHMHLEDVLKLQQGAVVPLDKLAGDPVDIYVNGRLVARGEVLVLNDSFCVRVAELIVGASACA
jgi:flagellar motor switch protein FliN/FliY